MTIARKNYSVKLSTLLRKFRNPVRIGQILKEKSKQPKKQDKTLTIQQAIQPKVENISYNKIYGERQSLYQNPEKLLEALENISDAFYIIDNEDRFVHINKSAEPLLRQSRENLIGHNIWETYSPAMKTDFYEKYYEAKHQQKPVLFEEYYEPFNMWTECRIYPTSDYVSAYFRDITERKRAEQERLQIGKLESLSMLSGGIAHDFNNLLTTIISNLALIRLTSQDAEATSSQLTETKIEEYLGQSEKACQKAKAITHQLLTFSKGDQPHRKLLKIDNLLEDAVNFAMHGSNIECSFNFAKDLWEIEADGGQLEQVLQNLAINARYAMNNDAFGTSGNKNKKSFAVSAQNFKMVAGRAVAPGGMLKQETVLPTLDGSYVLIKVSDNGCGIAPENIERIFDPYFTTKKDGNGIGLAICHSIVRKHDGYIFAKSSLGEGTTFYLYLPAIEKEKSPAEIAPVPALEPVLEQPNSAKVSRRRISRQKHGRLLLMDDDVQLIEAVSELLEYMGYQVTNCYKGEDVIELYRQAPTDFDAVILDLTIKGGMGGLEAIGKLQEINPQVKVIAASGYSESELLKDYLSYGFSGVVKKPYTIVELSRELDNLIS